MGGMTDLQLWQDQIARWRKNISDLGEDIRSKRHLIDRHVADSEGEKEIQEIAAQVADFERLIRAVQEQIDGAGRRV
jgi:hypothetical protein